MKRLTRNKHRRPVNRSGTATIELAICLPVLLTVTFSIIDTCNYLHLQQKLTSIAFETARLAAEMNGQQDTARQYGLAIATARGLTDVELTLSSDPSVASTVSAQARIPVRGNMPGPFVLFQNATASSEPVLLSVR